MRPSLIPGLTADSQDGSRVGPLQMELREFYFGLLLSAIQTAAETNTSPANCAMLGTCPKTTAATIVEVAGNNAVNNANIDADSLVKAMDSRE